MLDRAYKRLGPRYPIRFVALAVRLEYAIVVLGAAALSLYVPVSFGQSLVLAALAIAGQEGYVQLVLSLFRARLRPLEERIRGERGNDDTAAAWSVAASMPFELRVGLGVNSGPVVVGTIGGGGRLDFTVIGDAVNTAARVESATRDTGNDVLITGETYGRMRGSDGEWEERRSLSLKGKSEQVPSTRRHWDRKHEVRSREQAVPAFGPRVHRGPLSRRALSGLRSKAVATSCGAGQPFVRQARVSVVAHGHYLPLRTGIASNK
jgi:hypothetical protein